MPYLQDRKRNNNTRTALVIAICAIVFIILLFKIGAFSWAGRTLQGIALPFWKTRTAVVETVSPYQSAFTSKRALFTENEDLKSKLSEIEAKMQNYQTLLDENTQLKEAFGRKESGEQLLAAILVKPGQSLYDTLIVDAGTDLGVAVGQKVFSDGNILIGEVAEVYAHSSKIKMYSSAGEKLSVIISGKDITTEAEGRGGGNFEMIFPRDVDIPKGTEVVLPGIHPYLVGLVDDIISDPRDPLQKVLLRSPVNVQELKFVQIEK